MKPRVQPPEEKNLRVRVAPVYAWKVAEIHPTPLSQATNRRSARRLRLCW